MTLPSLGRTIAVLLLGSLLHAAQPGAEKAPQPGQLASAATIVPMTEAAAGGAPIAVTAPVSIADPKEGHDRLMHRLWITSMFAAVAGTGLDAATSWGKLESNSLLASSNGTFGAKGLSIKASVAAAVIIPQICLRKHKELRAAFVIGNFAEASIFSAAAIHNLRITSPSGN